MELQDIIRNNCQFVANSKVTVTVNRSLETVAIDGSDTEDGVFLQGDDARNFITEADSLYEKVGTVSLQECYEHQAYDYLDLLA